MWCNYRGQATTLCRYSKYLLYLHITKNQAKDFVTQLLYYILSQLVTLQEGYQCALLVFTSELTQDNALTSVTGGIE